MSNGNDRWLVGETFSASVIDTATAIYGHVTGSGDVLMGDGLERAVAWLDWRVREGWCDRGRAVMGENVFEGHVRDLARAAVELGQQALDKRLEQERAEAFQRRSAERAESGPMQFGDDWSGIFLRGKDAIAILGRLRTLEQVAEELPEKELRIIARTTARGLRILLGDGDHINGRDGALPRNCAKMRAFADCIAPTGIKETDSKP
jgi:hypothetical protein